MLWGKIRERSVVSWIAMINRGLPEGSLTLVSRFLKEETQRRRGRSR